jgi:pimeloyl-ACP methyl ester carboxylesterase
VNGCDERGGPVDDWSQGLPLAYAQEHCRSWAEDYDFGFAKRLNVFPQYRDTVEGLGIYLLHVRSPEPDAFPLVLTHGWPGSVLEFLEVLGPLTDPRAHGGDSADAFHVVAPSLPGYGSNCRWSHLVHDEWSAGSADRDEHGRVRMLTALREFARNERDRRTARVAASHWLRCTRS